MVTYSKDEIVGITELGKSLGSFIDKIHKNPLKKFAIIRRNKPEAVVLSIDEYERMSAISEAYEDAEIAKIVDQRVNNRKTPAKMISQEKMMSEIDKRLADV